MQFLQKHTYYVLGLVVLLLVYFVTRLVLLTSLPIFTDEAIYIRWAQIALHDPSWRFISLTDGKQPLFIWVMMPFLKFISDPLTAGRLVSVCAGAGSLVGLWLLSWELFKNKTLSFLTALLYIFYPLALLHDRLAIYDSMVAMWYIWSLYFSMLLVRKMTLTRSYHLGFVLGLSVLTKSGGLLSMALLPFTLLLLPLKQSRKPKTIYTFAICGIIAVLIGLAMYSILRLSPWFGIIGVKNAVFIYPLNEWLAQTMEWRYTLFLTNSTWMVQWLFSYLNVMYVCFLIIGLLITSFWKEKLVLFIYFFLPFIFDAMFGKVIYPRYMLFMTMMLLPIIAFGLYKTAMILYHYQKNISSAGYLSLLTLVALLPTMYFSYVLIFNPLQAPVPAVDRFQYIVGWPAGWGVKETLAFIKEKSANQKVYFATQGTFGLTPYGFEMYLQDMPNVTTHGYWPIDTTIPADLLAQAKKMPTYIYFYEPCTNCSKIGLAPSGWPITPVLVINKDNALHATLYQVNSK